MPNFANYLLLLLLPLLFIKPIHNYDRSLFTNFYFTLVTFVALFLSDDDKLFLAE